jgi:hypothetical protein
LVVGNPMDDSLPDTTSNVPDEPIEWLSFVQFFIWLFFLF